MENTLELLFAHADDGAPLLGKGMPLDVAGEGLKGKRFEALPRCFCGLSGDPADLEVQGWGVIAPQGARGDRLLALIDPLLKAREDEQDADVVSFRLPPGMRTVDVVQWRRDVFEARPASEMPRYLLILGDLDEISPEVERQLSSTGFLGRLAFSSDEDFASYVDKVLRWERGPAPEEPPDALFYSVSDGTAATAIGHGALLEPTLQSIRARKEEGTLLVRDAVEIRSGDPQGFLERVSASHPAMLFSMSHGLGAPRGGWRSRDEQLALQGAVCLGAGERIAGEDIRNRPFLPGGVWFLAASFGAGMPGSSIYASWLDRLHRAGQLPGRVDAVLAALPKPDDRPFIASLPKAALASPEGPLAVTASADLTWVYSFRSPGEAVRNSARHFQEIFRALGRGARAAMAHSELRYVAENALDELAVGCDEEERALAKGTPIEMTPARLAEKAHLWMLDQNALCYITLGDPAVRIPGARRPPRKRRGGAAGPAVPLP